MVSSEKQHFDDYTAQNRAKHHIPRAYLEPYIQILKGKVDRFHYIDGFAGKGRYQSENSERAASGLEGEMDGWESSTGFS